METDVRANEISLQVARSGFCEYYGPTMIDKLAVIDTIQTTFSMNVYPWDDFLLGSMEGSETLEEIEPFIGQADWTKIAPEVLDAHSGSLNFFSETGLRFFLPAYLVADLKDQLQIADPVFTLVHGFSNLSIPHELGDQVFVRKTGRDAFINPKRFGALTFHDYSRYRLSIFSREEAGEIVHYLEYKRDIDPDGMDKEQIDAALNSFWYERVISAPDDQTLTEHLQSEDDYLFALFKSLNRWD